MRRYWGLGLMLVPMILCGSLWWRGPLPEPSYAGRTVSQWLEAGYEDCAMGLQQIGPAAGPFVLAKLAREDSDYGTATRYRRVWARLPARFRAALPKPRNGHFDQLHAVSSLLELGRPIIPLLAGGLKDRNPAVRAVCARTLGSLRQEGCDLSKAVPALNEALGDSNPDVAAGARSALSQATATSRALQP